MGVWLEEGWGTRAKRNRRMVKDEEREEEEVIRTILCVSIASNDDGCLFGESYGLAKVGKSHPGGCCGLRYSGSALAKDFILSDFASQSPGPSSLHIDMSSQWLQYEWRTA